jgi:phosphatidylglycerophosphate synthase
MAIALTLSRLLIPVVFVHLLLFSTLGKSHLLAAISLVAFIVADICDGIYARSKNVDTTKRRISDGIVDRISVHTCYIATIIMIEASLWWYSPLLFRDLIFSFIVGSMYIKKRISVYPSWIVRFSHVLLGIGAVSIIMGIPHPKIILTAILCLLFVNLIEYIGLYTTSHHQLRPTTIYPSAFQGWKNLFQKQ